MDKLMTIAHIARELDLPESTVRYYRDRFADYIPSTGEGRHRRYPREALEVIKTIAEGLRNNETADQVREELNRLYPLNISDQQERNREQQSYSARHQPVDGGVNGQSASYMMALLTANSQALQGIASALEEIGEQKERIADLEDDVYSLKESQEVYEFEYARQKEEWERKLEERDQKIMKKMREILAEETRAQNLSWLARLIMRVRGEGETSNVKG